MKVVGMIPARMGSSRFPGKPLAKILGISMIEHVYKRCKSAKSLDDLYVATCDHEIKEAVEAFGGKVVMTADTHERASDRIAEAALEINADVYVMIQGDEPATHPEMIDLAIAPFKEDDTIGCVNLTKRIDKEEDFLNPDTIKVVMDNKNNALFMSRQAIPSVNNIPFAKLNCYKQVCIIPFTREYLMRYSDLEATPLEVAEKIDMMRFIEHGYRVKMVETKYDTHAVDRDGDIAEVEAVLDGDELLKEYLA
jgi:3-deoxy-manno-octulosonate cytidylyltransferase (CMP-KDO synthetase)